MTTELTTERLTLRPLKMADAVALERLIFRHAEVVKWLAHDISVPGNSAIFARDWCNDLALDGDNIIWARGGYGAFAITDRTGEFADRGSVLGIVGFYAADKTDGKWRAELFYALGEDFQGHGIMPEATAAAMNAFRKLPEAGDLYAVYWHTLNHASGRILRNLGFVEDGPQSVVEEYGTRDALSFYRFELWRIETAAQVELERVCREAAIKIGHLSYEGVISRSEALTSIGLVLARRNRAESLAEVSETAFDLGSKSVGLLHLSYRVPVTNELASPVVDNALQEHRLAS